MPAAASLNAWHSVYLTPFSTQAQIDLKLIDDLEKGIFSLMADSLLEHLYHVS